MISDWVRHYDATHVGAVASALPHNLLLAADGVSPEAPADWIQLPDGSGSTVTITNGAGEPVTLTASSTIQTWACKALAITACSGNVVAGTGQPPLLSVASVTGATGAAGTNGTNGSTGPAGPNWTSANSWALVTGSAYVAAIGEYVKADPTSAVVSVQAPNPAGNAGLRFHVQDATGHAATHTITITPHASETLQTSTITTNNGGVTLVSDGTNWLNG